MVVKISPEQLAKRLRSDASAVYLLDVREEFERDLACIGGSSHIPMAEIVDRTEEIPKDREIVVYCHHGTRSLAVASFLESRGYENVHNLHGGIDAWSLRVDPKVPRYS